MSKGIIKKWFKDREYGFIAVEGMHADVYFRSSDVQGISTGELREGLEVSFEVERNGDRLRAKRVKPTVSPQHAEQAEYRFVNPYNFVRFLEPPTSDQGDAKLMGLCAPPPHDRWVGLSGRIRCKLTVAEGSLLFVSDSEAIQDRGNGHRAYRFFELDRRPVIPATTLRGAIRSVLEAATNSCFSVFQEDEFPLEYREPSSSDLIPARVVKLCEDGSALLEILDCTKNPPEEVSLPSASTVMKAASVKGVYPPCVLTPESGNRPAKPYNSAQSSLNHIDESERDGLRVAALVTKYPVRHRSGRFASFEVEKLLPADQANSLKSDSDHVLVYGWLHATGPNIENKHDERLFFRWEKSPMPESVDQLKARNLIVTCSRDVVEEYNRHLAEYWDRHRKKAGTSTLPKLSNFVSPDRRLKEGDLVYYTTQSRKDGSRRQVIRAVMIPRRRYETRRQDLLPSHLHKCTDAQSLCPACRMFGWVRANDDDTITQASIAYGSRIRFTNAQLTGDRGVEGEKLLAILASPKPTAFRFYLAPKQGKPQDGLKDADANYDAQVRLRGRKMYWHHRANVKEYTRATDCNHDGRDDQNRTVLDARRPGNVFEFDISFENLAPVELGALLWSLRLEPGMYHRIGLAKPLGFGSVTITINSLELFFPEARYRNLDSGWKDETEQVDKYVSDFKSSMATAYGKARFEELNNVADLKAILSGAKIRSLPVHYPRSQQNPHPEGRNFEWFVGNKRGGKSPGPRLTLLLAADEEKGLPLIDSKGNTL